jgi:enolase
MDIQEYLEAPKGAEVLRAAVKQEVTVLHQISEFCAAHWKNIKRDQL